MYQVIKRDGGVVNFDLSKISSAIRKAFDALEKQYNDNIIDLLALKVTADYEPKIKDGKISVEAIQDSVEDVLVQAGYADVAKCYILYRKQREKIRNMKSTLLDYKDTVDKYMHAHDWRVKENSTVTYSVGGLILSKAELGAAINKAIFPGNQGGPLMHVIAGKAVCFGEALKPEFKDYQQRLLNNSKALAESLAKRGVNLVSGGTDNHLMLLDLRSLGVTGKDLEKRLDEVNITANKNAIPNDPETPFVTSGLRLGTAAATTRGLDESDMDKIAEFIYLAATDFENSADAIRAGVAAICAAHPLYE